MQDVFKIAKRNALNKADKSFAGEIDEKIRPLCDKISRLENYFTTSSCAGRITVVPASCKKLRKAFVFVSHSEISLEQILGLELNGLFYLRAEPAAIHVACKNLKDAQKLLNIARNSGFKKSGIISSKTYFVCELFSTEFLAAPIDSETSSDYLKLLVSEANKKLLQTQKKIIRLHESLQL